jgi:cholesterol oxidase
MFFNTSKTDRAYRTLRAPVPTLHPFKTSDGVDLLLTRYHGGDKGPVLLIHGLGVSSLIFAIDTIDTNLLEYLLAKGYDVWMLDYRSSILLPALHSQYTADTIATHDIPRAVDEVRNLTGSKGIQVIAHCYGGTTFTMAMLSGMQGVRSAVISQISAHVKTPPLLGIKAGLRASNAIEKLGITSLDASPDASAGWSDHLLDIALRLYPVEFEEQCLNTVCRRITFMYSLLYEHDQLNDATHDALRELFGEATLTAFHGLAAMIRAEQIIDAHGNDIYLPHLERLAIPIRFIHGEENACYLPESTALTLEALSKRNDPALYSRCVIPNYGHIDCIFGKNAAIHVYPLIAEHLDAT